MSGQVKRVRAVHTHAVASPASSFAYSALAREKTYSSSTTATCSAPFSRRRLASACTCCGGECSVSMPEEVGPPKGASTANRCFASTSSAASQAPKRVRTSRNARACFCASMRSSTMRAVSRSAAPHSALRAATRFACERRITPSSITFNALAASVAPVVVISTISSALPAAGAPSAALRISDELAHEVDAGHPEMHGPLRESVHDLRGGEISNTDARNIRDAATIVAGSSRLDQIETGAREECLRILLQPPLGGDGNDELLGHATPRTRASRSTQTAKPTAGIARALPSRVSRPS